MSAGAVHVVTAWGAGLNIGKPQATVERLPPDRKRKEEASSNAAGGVAASNRFIDLRSVGGDSASSQLTG
jgi:hypothetical protein